MRCMRWMFLVIFRVFPPVCLVDASSKPTGVDCGKVAGEDQLRPHHHHRRRHHCCRHHHQYRHHGIVIINIILVSGHLFQDHALLSSPDMPTGIVVPQDGDRVERFETELDESLRHRQHLGDGED